MTLALTVPAGLPRAALIATLSRALDLTEGEPLGHALRSCWIGMQLGTACRLSQDALAELYYALLLKDAGCSSNAAQVSAWFGTDDRTAKHDLKMANWTRFSDAARYAWAHARPEGGMRARLTQLAALAKRGPRKAARELVSMRCHRGAEVLRRLGWVELAPQAVLALDEHWDGSGYPFGLRGEAIPLAARILNLAQYVEIFWNRYGPAAARDMAQARSGTWFDPTLVGLFLHLQADPDFWRRLAAVREPADVAALDPRPRPIPADDHTFLATVAEVFAEIVDTKSPWTAQHSVRTGHYARTLATVLGYPTADAEAVGLAGFYHDLGKLGVSNRILDKPGPLSAAERRAMEAHPRLTYELLAPLAPLRTVAAVAGDHHERLDGSGYSRGLGGAAISPAARLIAVADVFDALTADRPYRRALDPGAALDLMRPEAGRRLDAEVFAALEETVNRGRLVPTAPPAQAGELA